MLIKIKNKILNNMIGVKITIYEMLENIMNF